MQYHYAQIDGNNICIAASDLSGPVDAPHMIPRDQGDTSMLGKLWNGSTWEDVPAPPPDPRPEGWPVISKYDFRQLLTDLQKLVWDNYDILKVDLGLTDMQFMQLRSFRADFDSAQVVTMDAPLMVNGLGTIATWNLQYSGQAVFTQADVTRILNGEGPM